MTASNRENVIADQSFLRVSLVLMEQIGQNLKGNVARRYPQLVDRSLVKVNQQGLPYVAPRYVLSIDETSSRAKPIKI